MAFHVPEKHRLKTGPLASNSSYGNNGIFFVKSLKLQRVLRCQASDDFGWEHVSVSLPTRCPSWAEMCQIKDLFWDPDDCVLQYHPPQSDYVDCHPFCLHLWRPVDQAILRPPAILVGPVTHAVNR
ncbi:DUF7694 domain-containing protein [Methylomonas sp. MgM2]